VFWSEFNVPPLLLNLLTAIVVAIVTALISVWLAFRRFRAERFWERRIDAYSRIVEALHNAKAFAEDHLEAEIEGSNLSPQRVSELKARSLQGKDEVFKAMDTGALLLPQQAVDRLRKYAADVNEASHSDMWPDYLDADLEAAQGCIRDITAIARRDLGLG
jgi:hypothetical protein